MLSLNLSVCVRFHSASVTCSSCVPAVFNMALWFDTCPFVAFILDFFGSKPEHVAAAEALFCGSGAVCFVLLS